MSNYRLDFKGQLWLSNGNRIDTLNLNNENRVYVLQGQCDVKDLEIDSRQVETRQKQEKKPQQSECFQTTSKQSGFVGIWHPGRMFLLCSFCMQTRGWEAVGCLIFIHSDVQSLL